MEGERHEHRHPCAVGQLSEAKPHPARHLRQPLRVPRTEDLAECGLRGREPRADGLVTGLARGSGDYELGVFRKQNQEMACVDERPAAFDHELEHAVQVGLAADSTRDGDGRLEPAHCAL